MRQVTTPRREPPLTRPTAPRRDPAPSRLTYRMQRLWLTPAFRSLLRKGVPLAVCAVAATLWLSDEANVQMLQDRIAQMRDTVESRPEFQVNLMSVDGASGPLTADIREILSLDLPRSSFDLDLPTMRAAIEELPAVRSADLRIRSGGLLAVMVQEREPTLIWRTRTGLDLIDGEGVVVAGLADRRMRGDLPIIAGDGANLAAAEALALFEAAAPLGDDLRGLVRVGERRWDLVLHTEQRILLPEAGAVEALERVIALNDAQDLLERDVVAVDLRDPARPIVRLSEAALVELRRIRDIEAQEESDG